MIGQPSPGELTSRRRDRHGSLPSLFLIVDGESGIVRVFFLRLSIGGIGNSTSVAYGAGGKETIYTARRDQILFNDDIEKSVAFAEDLPCLRPMF